MKTALQDCHRTYIGFVGTGIMGAPMAQRLLSAGYPVKVWNRTAAKALPMAGLGAQIANSCAEALTAVDVGICMLSTGPVVDDVLFTPDSSGTAAVERMSDGATLVVMSSIPVQTSQRQAKHLERTGRCYVDAPVSGGEAGAKAGKLTIMAGGEKSVVESVRGILDTMGTVTHVGPVGMGELAKIANQMIVGATIAAVAEALFLAQHGGADIGAVRQALCGGFADSTVLRQHGKRMQEGSFAPGALAVYQLKDLNMAKALAAQLHISLPVLDVVTNLYEQMCATELRDLDHSAVYLHLRKLMSQQSH